MNQDNQQEHYKSLMEVLELIEACDGLTKDVQAMPFEAMTPEAWEILQDAMDPMSNLLMLLKNSIAQGSKLIDDSELFKQLVEKVNDQE